MMRNLTESSMYVTTIPPVTPKLNDCFNDKFSFYIYFQGELKTLDDWIRETDLSGSFYFGGTLDYHF